MYFDYGYYSMYFVGGMYDPMIIYHPYLCAWCF